MPVAIVNDVSIWYDQPVIRTGRKMVFLVGLGNQAISTPIALLEHVVGEGFDPIIVDPRDAGYSERFASAPVPDQMKMMTGEPIDAPPYSLDDMAEDIVALLDNLEIDSAHFVGRSMGGMIAQLIAIKHPERVRSLALISTTTGNRAIGRMTPEAAKSLAGPSGDQTVNVRVDRAVRGAIVRGSKGDLATPVEELRDKALRETTRAYNPDGVKRHAGAIYDAWDRTDALKQVKKPSVVVHGTDDNVVSVDGGQALVDLLGAKALIIPGMGHDLPAQRLTAIAGAISANALEAEHALAISSPRGDIASDFG